MGADHTAGCGLVADLPSSTSMSGMESSRSTACLLPPGIRYLEIDGNLDGRMAHLLLRVDEAPALLQQQRGKTYGAGHESGPSAGLLAVRSHKTPDPVDCWGGAVRPSRS